MGQRIATGQAHPSDYLLFLYFLNVKGRSNTPVREEPQTNTDKDGNAPKDGDTKPPKEEANANAKAQGADEAKPTANNKKGEAFEDGQTNQKSLLSGEGEVGTYRNLNDAGSVGDNITPHHMPSDAFMKKNGGANYSRDNGISMNMEQPHPGTGGRHRRTATYDNSMTKAEQQAYWDLSPRSALARDIMDARRIYLEDGLYTPEIRQQILEAIKQNKLNYPDIFGK